MESVAAVAPCALATSAEPTTAAAGAATDSAQLLVRAVAPLRVAPFELDSVEAAADFVSQWVDARAAADPCAEVAAPTQSAAHTLRSGSGTASDAGALLAALLLGAGYDAYVVLGDAPAWVAAGDTARLVRRAGPPEASSAWVGAGSAAELRALALPDALASAADAGGSQLQPLAPHAWVLVRAGRRGVPRDTLVEPVSGVVVAAADGGALCVRARRVFNAANLWVARGGVGVPLRPGAHAARATSGAAPDIASAVSATLHALDAASPLVASTAIDMAREAGAASALTALNAPPPSRGRTPGGTLGAPLDAAPATEGEGEGAAPDPVVASDGSHATPRPFTTAADAARRVAELATDADGVPLGAPRLGPAALAFLAGAAAAAPAAAGGAGAASGGVRGEADAAAPPADGGDHTGSVGAVAPQQPPTAPPSPAFNFDGGDGAQWAAVLAVSAAAAGTVGAAPWLTAEPTKADLVRRGQNEHGAPAPQEPQACTTTGGRGLVDAAAALRPDPTDYVSLGPHGIDGVLPPRVVLAQRCKIESFPPRAAAAQDGLRLRVTHYTGDDRALIDAVEELFSERADRLLRRVRRVVDGEAEEAFARGRPDGLARAVDVLGRSQTLTFYADARADGLVRRRVDVRRKISEEFAEQRGGGGGDAPWALWYRSATFAAPPGGSGKRRGGVVRSAGVSGGRARPDDSGGAGRAAAAAAAAAHGGPADGTARSGTATAPPWAPEWALECGACGGSGSAPELTIIKMAEKWRPAARGREAAAAATTGSTTTPPPSRTPMLTAAHPLALPAPTPPVAKVMYDLAGRRIIVRLAAAPGRLVGGVREYAKQPGARGALGGAAPAHAVTFTVSQSGGAAELAPFDAEVEFRGLLRAERDCYAALRGRGKVAAELASRRMGEDAAAGIRALAEPSVALVANDRARRGVPTDDDAAAKARRARAAAAAAGAEDEDALLPFLLVARAADPARPTEKEARRADRECRAATKTRLLERVHVIQRRLDDEHEKLLRRQQQFSRTRDHSAEAEAEYERACVEATFRIGILEARLERQEALAREKYAALEARLAADTRLAALYRPQSVAGSVKFDARGGRGAGVLAALARAGGGAAAGGTTRAT